MLPSRFDTFGCVVTEAMGCGLPVAAYDCKGPRDIITHGADGVLASNAEGLAAGIVEAIRNGSLEKMNSAALKKASKYNAVEIMDKILADVG
jgi:glycosyltransferase involved in cell wall biosynthesis